MFGIGKSEVKTAIFTIVLLQVLRRVPFTANYVK